MRRQHRDDQRVAEAGRDLVGADAGRGDPVERTHERAVGRRRPFQLRLASTTDLVQILGEVRKVREIAERPHHDHRLLAAQRIENVFELAPRGDVVVPVERGGALPDALDDLERRIARVVADRVPEQPPEQADVVAKRAVRLDGRVHGRCLARSRRSTMVPTPAAPRARPGGRPGRRRSPASFRRDLRTIATGARVRRAGLRRLRPRSRRRCRCPGYR